MVFDGLLKDLRQFQEGGLGVDDEEKTDYIYNTVSVARPSALINKISRQSTSR